jgi:hypothetical protein
MSHPLRLAIPALAIVGALALSRPASAAPVKYVLDSSTALEADGWTFISYGVTASYASAGLTLTSTKGYAEWMLRASTTEAAPSTGWLATAQPGRGFWVEARFKVSSAVQCGLNGPGFRVDDGKTVVIVAVDTAKVRVMTDSTRDVNANTTDDFHTYRLTNLGAGHYTLSIDGNVVLDEPAVLSRQNDKSLFFGDMGGCDSSLTSWDYVAYDTFGSTSAPGDTDSDGVADTTDNCPLAANADQADADNDGIGNACDLCPADAQNDQDNDGLCAPDDPCPTDTRNDQDGNGVCDTQQCGIYETSVPSPPGCPSICHCTTFIGNDPIGGFGGGFDNFAGNPNYGMGGTGTAGSGAIGSGASAGAHVDEGGGAGRITTGAGGSSGAEAAGGTANAAGASVGGTGPRAGAGGQGNGAGTANTEATGAPESDDSTSSAHGCGCAIPKQPDSAWGAWLTCAVALGFAKRRRQSADAGNGRGRLMLRHEKHGS